MKKPTDCPVTMDMSAGPAPRISAESRACRCGGAEKSSMPVTRRQPPELQNRRRGMRAMLWAVVAMVLGVGGAARALPSDPELAALQPAAALTGRSWVEKPRVIRPLRPEESLATWRFDLPIP